MTPPTSRSLLDPPRVDPVSSVDALVALLERSMGMPDADVDPDPVDIGHHSLQCAVILAGSHPDDDELVAAGLVHDLGHVVAPGCSAAHGDVAAAMLSGLLGPRVARLVALHVPAKRYLAAEPDYAAALSDGSTASLAVQGGPMVAAERTAMEADPDLESALTLRRADEAAKVPGADVPGLAHWVPLLERVAARCSATSGVSA